MSDILDGVKIWMRYIGWTDGGAPGSTKRDADDTVIAHYGDATWIENVQSCVDRVMAQKAKAELERRGNLGT